jgi:thiamine biosynthesis lipoprotein
MTSQSTSPVIQRGSKDKPWPTPTLAGLLLALTVFSTPSAAEWYGDSRPMMGTEISVYLWHDDPVAGDDAVEAVFAEVARIDQLMSTTIEDSRISEINRNAMARRCRSGTHTDDSALSGHLDLRSVRLTLPMTVGQHYDFRERRHPDAATERNCH